MKVLAAQCLAVDSRHLLNERPPVLRVWNCSNCWMRRSLDPRNPAAMRTCTLRGAVFSLRSDLLPSPICDLLQTAARAVFVARRGTLSDQLARLREPEPVPRRRANPDETPREVAARTTPPLEFFNGLGGFAAEAREYLVVLDEGQWTPAPWVNVIANPQFGFLASAEGSGSTWSLNAQQNPLTPWSNDPVSNAPAEALYIRDEDSGALWSATAALADTRRAAVSYTYVVLGTVSATAATNTRQFHGIGLNLLQFVPLEIWIKISRLQEIVNASAETRRLSVTHYLIAGVGQSARRDGLASSSPKLIPPPEPCWRAIPGAMDFSRGWPSWTWPGGNKPTRPIAPSSSDVMGPWPSRPRCSGRIR